MKDEKVCPVCRGTGFEKHTYVRDDGEEITESIRCKLCDGTGQLKCDVHNFIFKNENIHFPSAIIGEENFGLNCSNFDEDDNY